MTRSERAMQIWPILVAAAHNRQTLTYGDLAQYLEFDGAGVFAQMLDRIMVYCDKKALPPLTCLVVNQGSGLPGSGLKTAEDLPRDREDVYSKNWYAMYPPQIADFEEASA